MKSLIVILSIITIMTANGGYGDFKAHNFDADTNPVDALALEGALKSIEDYNAKENQVVELQLIRIENCEIKMVAGWIYKLTLCLQDVTDNKAQFFYELELYVIPWEENVTVNSVKQVKLDGAVEPANENEIAEGDQQKMTEACQQKIRNTVNSILGDKVKTQILTKQVVSGTTIVYQVDFENTQLNQVKSFDCTIWYRPWLSPKFEVTRIKDHSQQNLGSVNAHKDGDMEEFEFNPQNNLLSELAYKSLISHMEQMNNVDLASVNVVKAHSQIVSGVNLFLDVEYNQDGKLQHALVTVWVQAWAKTAKVTSFVGK